MKLSEHFSEEEFFCKHCGKGKVSEKLIEKLEELRKELNNTPIIITSGYRCPIHSVNVGGSYSDAHTMSIAADIQVKGYTPEEVCAAAEKVGFSGIGLMRDATHVDVRTKDNYFNAHWFGNEITGENVETFLKKNVQYFEVGKKKFKVTIEEV